MKLIENRFQQYAAFIDSENWILLELTYEEFLTFWETELYWYVLKDGRVGQLRSDCVIHIEEL